MEDNKYYFCSWNVNGYSQKVHDWLISFLKEKKPDLVFLSETKRMKKKLEHFFDQIDNYNYIINPNVPATYHGVALLIRKDRTFEQTEVEMSINPRYDTKSEKASTGRIISGMFEKKYHMIGTYVPNSGNDKNMEKLRYRIEEWDKSFQSWLNRCKEKHPVVWMGDINVAVSEKDVSNPKRMLRFAGFKNEERASFFNFLSTEWIDIWRFQHMEERLYSWRGRNKYDNSKYGMRLDSIILSKHFLNKMVDSFMISDCPLSDHVPICAIIN